MIVSALKQCCYLCNYPAIEVEEQRLVGAQVNAYVYCDHDKVCNKYNESEEKKDT